MQQSNVQVTAIAALKGAFLDAVAKYGLMFPKGFNNVGPHSRNLLALVVADGERVSYINLQLDAALHHQLVDAIQQPRHGLSAAVSTWVGKTC